MKKSVTAQVLGSDFACRVCTNPTFAVRYIQLNSAGAEFFDFGWANKSSTGLICTQCGYIHEFLGDTVSLYET